MNAVGESPAARVSAIPQPGRPSAPRDLTAVEAGQTQIDLNWAAPSNSGNSTIDGYRIEKSDNAGSDRTVLVANSAIQGTSHSDTSGLSPGATRHYRVSAINSAGIGAHSEVDRATAASPDGPPHPVFSLNVPGYGGGFIVLAWYISQSDTAPDNEAFWHRINGGDWIEVPSPGGLLFGTYIHNLT